MGETENIAQRLWVACETIHARAYFERATRKAVRAAGADSFWQGYFGCRLAPVGTSSSRAASAMVYVFDPGFVDQHFASPELAWALWEARTQSVVGALEREATYAHDLGSMLACAERLVEKLDRQGMAGRPLAAAHLDLYHKTESWARLWLATTIVREFRWDGHIAVLIGYGLSGLEAMLLALMWRKLPVELAISDRGWSEASVFECRGHLESAGLIVGENLTPAGEKLRNSIERETDQLALLDTGDASAAAADLVNVLEPLAARCQTLIPWDNPIGVVGAGESLARRHRPKSRGR